MSRYYIATKRNGLVYQVERTPSYMTTGGYDIVVVNKASTRLQRPDGIRSTVNILVTGDNHFAKVPQGAMLVDPALARILWSN